MGVDGADGVEWCGWCVMVVGVNVCGWCGWCGRCEIVWNGVVAWNIAEKSYTVLQTHSY